MAVVAAPVPAGARSVPALVVRTSVTPHSAAVGRQVVATVEVAVDPARIDLAAVEIRAALTPLDLEGQTRTVAQGSGAALIRERLTAACLSEACLPVSGPATVSFPPVRVSARARDGSTVTATGRWPTVLLVPRVTRAEAGARVPAWQVQHDLPALTTRVAPRTLELAFTVLGVLLAVAAGVLTAAAGGRRASRAAARAQPTLADALAAVRRTARGTNVADRRVALDLLSRSLTGRGEGQAGQARDLAWSERRPTAEGMESLAVEVEQAEAAP
jgi:hypothetical protein